MATIYKIHPAIGIARVGNSPGEFFIGPEHIGAHPSPAGGFKDADCRVKRQAARFRIFAHHDDNTVQEITSAEADITWTVHLVNKKAANPLRGNSEPAGDLSIDPGARTLTGPSQIAAFDNGKIKFAQASAVTVPLGEIRSDTHNRLLVLGGYGKSASPTNTGIGSFWGNAGWYDDVSDGPVSATIKLHANNATPSVMGAWVMVGPPKFAPDIDNVITLYDRLFQAMVDANLLAAPTTTSYIKDVYPILQRARDTRWVDEIYGNHAWPDPVTGAADRSHIFSRLTAPNASQVDMPDLNENTPDGRLTPIQYAHMQRWKDNNYNNDWNGPPAPQAAITPDGLDRSALENCVGGPFYPGIEAGGREVAERPILFSTNYTEPFRLSHTTLAAGDMTYVMALPWQADFYACSDNWWPVPRPDQVIPQGQSASVDWARGLGSYQDMVDHWSSLGFIVRQGNQHVEVSRCDTASIALLTPHLDFQDVPQGPMGMVRKQPLAISFEVISPSMAVTLKYASGGAPNHPQLFAYNSSVTVGPTTGGHSATAQLWIVFSTGAVGAIAQQTVTVQDAASGQQWTVTIDGNTVARKTAATALVLDRSLSMSEDRGDGQSKHLSLQQAAGIFIDVMLEGDGVGLVSFSDDAAVIEQVVKLGDASLTDINRSTSKDLINGNGLDPLGNTSIGDGIAAGRGILNGAANPYDVKALVVLTDGVENRSLYIADVAGQINEQTYAVGLGMPQNISTAALQTISGNNGGYLLLTGAIGTDNRFMLQKYFLQILAGISNAEIVLDPDGLLVPGTVQRIPFHLTDADAGVDVILLSPAIRIIDFRLQTPKGLILEPWRAMSEPGMRFFLGEGVSYYRLVLPAELVAHRFDQGGTWHALLTIGAPHLAPTRGGIDGVDFSILRGGTRAAALERESISQRRRLEANRRAVIVERAPAAAPPSANAAASRAARPEGMTTTAAAVGRVPYSLVVHSYSNLSFHAAVEQTSHEPGAKITLRATLAESGMPVADAAVSAEVTRPGGQTAIVEFKKEEPGTYVAVYTTSSAGVYRFRVRARGATRKGLPFTRERTLTAGVWRGGDRDQNPSRIDINSLLGQRVQSDSKLCELLQCLLSEGRVISAELEKALRAQGFDLARLRECLKLVCSEGAARHTHD